MSTTRLSSQLRWPAVLALVVGTAGVAHAASLGGLDVASLTAFRQDVDIETPVVACNEFSAAPNGTGLAGYPAGCGGGTWSTSGGNWHVVNGRLKANATSAIATVAGPSPDLSVGVTVIGTDTKNRVGGVIVSHDGATGSHLAAVLVGPSTVELRLVSGGSSTTLATATVAIPTAASLRLTRLDDQAWVQLGGATVVSGTFTALSALTGTGAGLLHGGGPAVEFDDFLVTLATPP